MSVSRKAVGAGGWRVVPLGDRCLIVEFESRVDAGINRRARSFAGLLLRDPPPGVVDVVPAFCTVAVYYRPESFEPTPSPFQQLRVRIEALLEADIEPTQAPARDVSGAGLLRRRLRPGPGRGRAGLPA